jgi:hypothetical protein
MARTTHVKKAQQRYETVVVLDPITKEPQRTPVMKTVTDRETGEKTQVQKTTKKGRPVFMTQTVADKTKPKPPETCTACHKPIEIGTPYKWIQPKSGPYGGRRMSRHESCPSWQVWDYSNSLSAQLARISHDFWEAVDQAESTDDVAEALSDAGAAVDEIAEQKKEGASNIEEGFGHPTSASEELESQGDELESWAEEIRSADVPDVTECEECSDGEKDCDTCGGDGEHEIEAGAGLSKCEDCQGTGVVSCDNCDGSGEDIDAWRDELRDNLSIVDESPV